MNTTNLFVELLVIGVQRVCSVVVAGAGSLMMVTLVPYMQIYRQAQARSG